MLYKFFAQAEVKAMTNKKKTDTATTADTIISSIVDAAKEVAAGFENLSPTSKFFVGVLVALFGLLNPLFLLLGVALMSYAFMKK